MKVIIDIPELKHHQNIHWDTSVNFKPPCPCSTPGALHGFPFKEQFAVFEKSEKKSMRGSIPCMAPDCPMQITFTMRREG